MKSWISWLVYGMLGMCECGGWTAAEEMKGRCNSGFYTEC